MKKILLVTPPYDLTLGGRLQIIRPRLLANSIDLSGDWELVGFLFSLFLLPLASFPHLHENK